MPLVVFLRAIGEALCPRSRLVCGAHLPHLLIIIGKSVLNVPMPLVVIFKSGLPISCPPV